MEEKKYTFDEVFSRIFQNSEDLQDLIDKETGDYEDNLELRGYDNRSEDIEYRDGQVTGYEEGLIRGITIGMELATQAGLTKK